jgi:serine phosphatase RsbU (regulator of sigma subunit)
MAMPSPLSGSTPTPPTDGAARATPGARASGQNTPQTNAPVLLLVSDEQPAAQGGWWAERVAPVWPGEQARPHVRTALLSDLHERLDAKVSVERSDAVVIVAGDATPLGALMRAASVLREAARTGVVLLSDAAPGVRARLEGVGLLVQDRQTDPRTLAGLLCGLMRSTRTVRELESELATSAKLQAGARRWIRRVDEELHMAARMQQDLLPRSMPESGAFRFGALYRPLWHVSGDIYRVCRADEHRVSFMIADAMGHGVRAAMSAMILAHGLVIKDITQGGHRVLGPGEALARLNEEMLRHPSPSMRFASALCGVLDTRTGHLELAGAGHPHPLLVERDPAQPHAGRLRRIDMDGPLLGVFEGGQFPVTSLQLHPGQTLAVYTDGLEAAFDAQRGANDDLAPDEPFCQRLIDTLASPVSSLDAALEQLGAWIDGAAGSLHRADDVTLLALRAL